jgi:hypothetical protein
VEIIARSLGCNDNVVNKHETVGTNCSVSSSFRNYRLFFVFVASGRMPKKVAYYNKACTSPLTVFVSIRSGCQPQGILESSLKGSCYVG